jgi:hypothetical protein
MDQVRTGKKIFESKHKGIRRKEDLDIDGLKIWRRICWK